MNSSTNSFLFFMYIVFSVSVLLLGSSYWFFSVNLKQGLQKPRSRTKAPVALLLANSQKDISAALLLDTAFRSLALRQSLHKPCFQKEVPWKLSKRKKELCEYADIGEQVEKRMISAMKRKQRQERRPEKRPEKRPENAARTPKRTSAPAGATLESFSKVKHPGKRPGIS